MLEQLDLFGEGGAGNSLETNVKNYITPRRTEYPKTKKDKISWIKDFCKANDIGLPKKLSQRDRYQVDGLYYGMLRTYNVQEESIISQFAKKYY